MDKYIVAAVKSLRHELHQIPELSLKESKTRKRLMEELKKYEHLQVVDRGAWFYAFYEGKTDRKTIAFRADFDAVEGKGGCPGHFCGHDGHAAILAGFGRYLNETKPDVSVYLIFQPAEEIGEGAKLCCPLLKEKNISEIYGFHNIPGFKKKSILLLEHTFACASTGLEITVEGAPSHAAYPENGKNPADVIAKLILMRHDFLAKPHKGLVQATVVGCDLGSAAYGVSASKGILRMTLRGETNEDFDRLVADVSDAATRLSRENGMTCQIKKIDEFPATVNDPACVHKVKRAAAAVGLETVVPFEPFRWSEDFGWYLKDVKGAFFGVGDGEEYPQLHTEKFEFPDDIIETVLDVYAGLLEA